MNVLNIAGGFIRGKIIFLSEKKQRKNVYSLKRSDVTRWKKVIYKHPLPPYVILWNAVTSLGESKVI